MTAVGGSIQDISIKGRLFTVAADADAARKSGGFENEVSSNGDGSARLIKTRVPWSLEGITATVDDDAEDLEFLQEIADRNSFVTITITFVNGNTYSGTGQISGDFAASSMSATTSLNLSGPQKLVKQ